MNTRIQELAKQAGFYVAGSGIYIPSTSEDITTCQTKFAELIVRECAQAIRSDSEKFPSSDTTWIAAMEESARVVLKHFGVK